MDVEEIDFEGLWDHLVEMVHRAAVYTGRELRQYSFSVLVWAFPAVGMAIVHHLSAGGCVT